MVGCEARPCSGSAARTMGGSTLAELSRAKGQDAIFTGANMRSVNAYEVNFGGSDLTNVDFDNAILTNARFGKGKGGEWAKLGGG